MSRNENEKKRKRLPSQTALFFRLVVGVYVIWLAYSIVKDMDKFSGAEYVLFLVFAALFVAAGLWILASSGRALKEGRYLNGVMDIQQEMETGEETAAIQQEEKKRRIRFDEDDGR